MKLEIEKWEGKAGFSRYLRWLDEAHAHYEISVTEVLHKNFTSIFNLLRWDFLSRVLVLHPFESIYSRAARYFHSERLRRVFTFGSMYMGMSPFDAPGTYSLLQYTELAEGIWYPIGGFWAVVKALVKVGERLGVKYRLNCPVERVLLDSYGKKARGVRLASGEEVLADVVVVNADLVYAYNNLFPALSSTEKEPDLRPTPYAHALTQKEGSCSSLSFYWSLSEKVPALTTHNIFLADEYRESFDAIFKKQSIPNEPSFYVNVPSRIDPTAAPESKDSLVILVPIGHLKNSRTAAGGAIESGTEDKTATSGSGLDINSTADLETMIRTTRSKVIETIKSRTGTDLKPLITNEILNTPPTWAEKFNLDKGCILGLSHSFFNVLAFRPSITHTTSPGILDGLLPGVGARRGLENVYFVGASTHPGTGVPIVLAGSKLTAGMVCKEAGIPVPWSEEGDGSGRWEEQVKDQGIRQSGGVDEIDRLQKVPVWGTETLVRIFWGVVIFLLALYWGFGGVGICLRLS